MSENYRLNAVTFVDELGKVRITVSTSDEGDPFIAVIDNEGSIKAIYTVTPDEEPYLRRTK